MSGGHLYLGTNVRGDIWGGGGGGGGDTFPGVSHSSHILMLSCPHALNL